MTNPFPTSREINESLSLYLYNDDSQLSALALIQSTVMNSSVLTFQKENNSETVFLLRVLLVVVLVNKVRSDHREQNSVFVWERGTAATAEPTYFAPFSFIFISVCFEPVWTEMYQQPQQIHMEKNKCWYQHQLSMFIFWKCKHVLEESLNYRAKVLWVYSVASNLKRKFKTYSNYFYLKPKMQLFSSLLLYYQ